MTYLFIDTETTGLGSSDVVLQLAYIATNADGRELLYQNALFAHDFEFGIHPDAAKVNGLTVERVKANGYAPRTVVQILQKMPTLMQTMYVIGHNVSFDIRLLRQTCDRYGLALPSTINTICTKSSKSVREFVGAMDKNGRVKAPSLAELHRHLFGEDFDGAHDALADVRATARCFFELKRLGIVV